MYTKKTKNIMMNVKIASPDMCLGFKTNETGLQPFFKTRGTNFCFFKGS